MNTPHARSPLLFVLGISIALCGCSTSVRGRTDAAADAATADNSTPGPDGWIPDLDSTVVLPDGAVIAPDSAVISPDGAVVPPDDAWTMVGPDGEVIGPDGAVITPDGAVVRPDGAVVRPDGGVVATVGTPCTSDDQCPGLFCSRRATGFGYCSWVCNDTMPCPGGSVCARFGTATSVGYCMPRCDPMAPSCAMGTICEPGIADAPVCYPGCAGDMDCPTGQRCGPGAGGVNSCYTPTATAGAACALTGQCPAGGYCLDEESWGVPHGECVTFCDLTTLRGCDTGTTCVAWGYRGAGSCIPTCDDAHPCRAGYLCAPTRAGGPSACVPRCTTDADCSDGRTCSFVTGRCGSG